MVPTTAAAMARIFVMFRVSTFGRVSRAFHPEQFRMTRDDVARAHAGVGPAVKHSGTG
jgi:hypothetical protein